MAMDVLPTKDERFRFPAGGVRIGGGPGSLRMAFRATRVRIQVGSSGGSLSSLGGSGSVGTSVSLSNGGRKDCRIPIRVILPSNCRAIRSIAARMIVSSKATISSDGRGGRWGGSPLARKMMAVRRRR